MRSIRWISIIVIGSAWLLAHDRSAISSQAPAVVSTSAGDDQFKIELTASLVSVDVGVYDRNEKAVTNLGRDDFRVYEDGVIQPIRDFTPVSGGYRILLLVDHSGSMQRYWSFLLDGLNVFMKDLRPQDQVAIATFDNDVHVDMTWRSALTGTTEKVAIAPNGKGTRIWDSVRWAVREVGRSSGRKGVILFTDGDDVDSDFKQGVNAAAEGEVPFYIVGVTTTNPANAERLKQLAQISGGRAYFPKNPNELGPLYASIARDLGSSYTISYAPLKPPGDNKLRRIEIRPIDVRLHVTQSRGGYYAK